MLWWKQVTLECETSNSNPASSLQWVATCFLLLYRLIMMTRSHHIGLCEYFDSYLNSDQVQRLEIPPCPLLCIFDFTFSLLRFWSNISSALLQNWLSTSESFVRLAMFQSTFVQRSRQLLDSLTSKQTELSLIINPPSSFFVLQNCPKWGQLICRAAKSLKYFFCFCQTRSAGTMS